MFSSTSKVLKENFVWTKDLPILDDLLYYSLKARDETASLHTHEKEIKWLIYSSCV